MLSMDKVAKWLMKQYVYINKCLGAVAARSYIIINPHYVLDSFELSEAL